MGSVADSGAQSAPNHRAGPWGILVNFLAPALLRVCPDPSSGSCGSWIRRTRHPLGWSLWEVGGEVVRLGRLVIGSTSSGPEPRRRHSRHCCTLASLAGTCVGSHGAQARLFPSPSNRDATRGTASVAAQQSQFAVIYTTYNRTRGLPSPHARHPKSLAGIRSALGIIVYFTGRISQTRRHLLVFFFFVSCLLAFLRCRSICAAVFLHSPSSNHRRGKPRGTTRKSPHLSTQPTDCIDPIFRLHICFLSISTAPSLTLLPPL
ncbi:hypothetical protein K461DRAFT_151643 [Myriangium duriaei CBS 260.36]|uniref:Uncharacterized protein n=1 Tax=Myriangium duriaei CBS 260.36 TaxID=1168546 RepID=A0A9P4J008_9PEZI|nr:hypothetical protein K461DRAFT_151643 [Myriangium duriaei CBS 260.36]